MGEESTYVVITLGAPTVLQCYAVGWPRPAVTWWRGDNTLPTSSIQYEQRRDFSLLIKSVGLRDLGPYVCQAYNGQGKAASGTVVIQAIGPVYTSNPEDQAFNQYLVTAPEKPAGTPPRWPRPPPPRPRPENITEPTIVIPPPRMIPQVIMESLLTTAPPAGELPRQYVGEYRGMKIKILTWRVLTTFKCQSGFSFVCLCCSACSYKYFAGVDNVP